MEPGGGFSLRGYAGRPISPSGADWRFVPSVCKRLVVRSTATDPLVSAGVHRNRTRIPRPEEGLISFQATHDKLDLLVGLAKPQRNPFEKDSHRVIALDQGDGVGRIHYGHIFAHARPRKRALQAPAY
jgi:hypothetical protein